MHPSSFEECACSARRRHCRRQKRVGTEQENGIHVSWRKMKIFVDNLLASERNCVNFGECFAKNSVLLRLVVYTILFCDVFVFSMHKIFTFFSAPAPHSVCVMLAKRNYSRVEFGRIYLQLISDAALRRWMKFEIADEGMRGCVVWLKNFISELGGACLDAKKNDRKCGRMPADTKHSTSLWTNK